MDLKIFGTDKVLEVEGVWHDIDDARIKVARFNSQKYQNRLRALLRPHQAIINAGGDQSAIIVDRVTTQCIAETILVDWENISDNGDLLIYSSENARMLLDKYPDFKELVASLATQAQHYRTAVREESAKN